MWLKGVAQTFTRFGIFKCRSVTMSLSPAFLWILDVRVYRVRSTHLKHHIHTNCTSDMYLISLRWSSFSVQPFFLNLITHISEYFYRPFQELNLYINFIIIITLKSEHLSRKHHILYIPLAEGPLILYIYVVEWPKVAKIPVSEEEEMVRNI